MATYKRNPKYEFGLLIQKKEDARDPTDFKKLLKRRLPTYKLPREVLVLPDLPKNESGKIMKNVLKARYASSR